MNKKHSTLIKAVLGLFVLGIAIAYVVFPKPNASKNEERKEIVVATSTFMPTTSTLVAPMVPTSTTGKRIDSVSEPLAWKTYTDSKFGFSFQYPASSKITFSSSSNSTATAVTITMEEENAYEGNGRSIKFMVYEKGSFIQYTEEAGCRSFLRSELVVDGRTIDIAEHEKCRGEEGIVSPTHYIHAIIPLSDNEIIVFTAGLGSIPFGKSSFVIPILKTLKFIPRT